MSVVCSSVNVRHVCELMNRVFQLQLHLPVSETKHLIHVCEKIEIPCIFLAKQRTQV